MNTDTLPQIINPELPIQTLTGQKAHIVDILDEGRYPIVGIINYGGGQCRFMKWDEFGNPEKHAAESGYNIENIPGYESINVHLNIYEDDTGGYSTGYGYASKQLADKYAPVDNRLPVVGQVKTQLVFSDPHCHPEAQPKDLPQALAEINKENRSGKAYPDDAEHFYNTDHDNCITHD